MQVLIVGLAIKRGPQVISGVVTYRSHPAMCEPIQIIRETSWDMSSVEVITHDAGIILLLGGDSWLLLGGCASLGFPSWGRGCIPRAFRYPMLELPTCHAIQGLCRRQAMKAGLSW